VYRTKRTLRPSSAHIYSIDATLFTRARFIFNGYEMAEGGLLQYKRYELGNVQTVANVKATYAWRFH
jgi:hypothetical protein